MVIMQLVFTPRFRNEMRKEYQYIRERNEQAAESVRERIMRSIDRLKMFPQSGRAWRLPTTMELIIPSLPYIVIYKLDGDNVVLLTLFHTARQFPPNL